jgi:nitrogen regulatory protein P-II 1
LAEFESRPRWHGTCIDKMAEGFGEGAKDGKEETMTKKIEAIIREEALGAVKEALREIGIVGMNVSEIRGHGRQGGIPLSWRGTSYNMDLIPKLQLNIVLSERNLQATIDAIARAARTGVEGDGIIFVYPVEDIVRIRTGERGQEAISYPDDIDSRSGKKGAKP